jgi:3-methyladenine DNA glycosylase AlkD
MSPGVADLMAALAARADPERAAGLMILVAQARTNLAAVADFYLAAVRRGRVNNWDLVDMSAGFILGEYLFDRPRDILFELACSIDIARHREAAAY